MGEQGNSRTLPRVPLQWDRGEGGERAPRVEGREAGPRGARGLMRSVEDASLDAAIAPIFRNQKLDLPALCESRVRIRPMLDTTARSEIDVTHTIVAAVAQELHRLHAGNHVLNWLEAERMVEHALHKLSTGSYGANAGALPPEAPMHDPR